ncbi:hypothetical protein [Jiella marina]|uniref:hypothetical protein n=1 Tax=Jiella sp. LLJ827 TaxID=2917712 RepID=UPI0021008629|nr:hypothetical protein [Jiella sp. LLJ827]MCQ0987777.1 hypothetical protein [Jiella sp. LLJ827]
MFRSFGGKPVLGAVMAAVLVTGAQAQQAEPSRAPMTAQQGGVSELILPYSPYVFDLAVASARSVAEITYRGRRFDPVTRALVVTGLEVRRGPVHFRIGQMRVGAERTILDDVVIDTRRVPLEPEVRQVLQRLDREIVNGDVAIGIDANGPAADYVIQATANLEGIGALDLDADLRGFHILVPIDEFDEGMRDEPFARRRGDEPEVVGRIASASLGFTDAGLTSALYEVLGGAQGLSPEAARNTASALAGIAVASIFKDMPGGSTPELNEAARRWSAGIQAFLREPGRIAVSLRPAEPFDIARLTDGIVEAADIVALNPSVVEGVPAGVRLLDPGVLMPKPDAPLSQLLAIADTLIAGRGTPQNVERAVALVMPAAIDGNRAAVGLLAKAIAIDPHVSVPQDRLRAAYVALDLATAEGLPNAAESRLAIGRRLSPSEIVGAEDEAVAIWRKTPIGTQQRQAEVEAFRNRDWKVIRRLAYAYYEGVDMPRNIMRAYGWASIAAAGGDQIAAAFRDELTRAAGSGRLVLPLDRAREATNDLWAIIVEEGPDRGTGSSEAPAEAEPAEGNAATDAPDAAAAGPAAGVPPIPDAPSSADATVSQPAEDERSALTEGQPTGPAPQPVQPETVQ